MDIKMKPIGNMYYKPESHTDFIFSVIGDWPWTAVTFIFVVAIIYFVIRFFKSKH
jgi:cell division protein FtsW (lipid II flippase)